MKSECNSDVENNFCELVENIANETFGSRCKFAFKLSHSGEITKGEARFIAKDFSQVLVRDYGET